MTKLVECVPNFSEARRPEVVAQIRSAIAAIEGVTFLDQHSDADHNRTVLTFVGEPEAVERAAFDAIKTAAQLIDLDHHTGEHPRIGATDVVPFVPISGVTLEECVAHGQAPGRTRRPRVEHSRLSLRSGCHAPRSRESGEHPARPV